MTEGFIECSVCGFEKHPDDVLNLANRFESERACESCRKKFLLRGEWPDG